MCHSQHYGRAMLRVDIGCCRDYVMGPAGFHIGSMSFGLTEILTVAHVGLSSTGYNTDPLSMVQTMMMRVPS